MQKALIIIGIAIVLVGIGWPWLSKLPLGRLPGDFVIDRQNFRIYFPLATMVILSILLSAILWLLRK
jgi:peptidoglycan biosynthesis protein MviN/MurJ (putative lipid II flippase)